MPFDSYEEYAVAFRKKLHDEFAIYTGHEWRECVPLKSGYVCCECGAEVKSAAEMAIIRYTCKPRLAPKSWQPQKAN